MSRDVQPTNLEKLKARAEERGIMRLTQSVPVSELANVLHALGPRKVAEAHAYDVLRVALSLQEVRAQALASDDQVTVCRCDRYMRRLQGQLRVLLPQGLA